jgi:hypothetical protein
MLLEHPVHKIYPMDNQEIICCTLNVHEFQKRQELLQSFRKLILHRTEMENGFIFTFNGDGEVLREIFIFLEMERQCCPFFSFGLVVGNERQEVQLKISGPEGVKHFLLHEMGLNA